FYCGLWPAGAAWLAHHLWERYAYDLDEAFLRERAYPGMKEAARFVLDFLVEDPETGELLFGPSLSPENQYLDADGIRSGLCMSPAGDTQIIVGLFERLRDAAAILGVDDDRRTELSAARGSNACRRCGSAAAASCRSGARTTSSGRRGTATSRTCLRSTRTGRSLRGGLPSSRRRRAARSSCASRRRRTARSAAGASA